VLQAVYGRGQFEGSSFRVEGKTSVVLRTRARASELKEVIEEVESVLSREPSVPFVQSFDAVEDQNLVALLTDQLERQVLAFLANQGTRDSFYVEFGEPLTQFKTIEFKVSLGRKSVTVDDFDLEVMQRAMAVAQIAISSAQELRRLKVQGLDENGHTTIYKTAIWEHLIGEIRYENRDYLRLGSRWLCLREELFKALDLRIKEIPVITNEFMPWEKSVNATEADYNKWIANQKQWHCLDQDFVGVRGYSRLELCDLFDPIQRRFFHVKETWGSKSSYLFSQGLVAGEAFHSDSLFREHCVRKWPFLANYPISGGEILFGVALPPEKIRDFPTNLTYFAKLSLCAVVDALNRLAYRVSLCSIQVD
jgi:uncharacterized protein (TIGR04141 family)